MIRGGDKNMMLETLFYVFLAGCSDDLSQCEQIPGTLQGYPTAQSCEQALSEVFATVRSDWPTTSGICAASATDRIAATPDWLRDTPAGLSLTNADMIGKSPQ